VCVAGGGERERLAKHMFTLCNPEAQWPLKGLQVSVPQRGNNPRLLGLKPLDLRGGEGEQEGAKGPAGKGEQEERQSSVPVAS